MNEINPLETQLRSWAPRRPSTSIEKKLFGRRLDAQRTPSNLAFGWFAPVTALLLLAGLIYNEHGGASVSASNGQLVALILSNQSAASYLPGSFQRDQNIITANTFEWTNAGHFPSSIRSLPGRKGSTNK